MKIGHLLIPASVSFCRSLLFLASALFWFFGNQAAIRSQVLRVTVDNARIMENDS